MFESLQAAPPDAILGLAETFRNDTNPNRINLTVGVFKDESGQTPVLASVKLAEARVLESETSKGYLPIDGNAEFCRLTRELYLGTEHEIVTSGRIATAQCPGGTGALRVAAEFVSRNLPSSSIHVSTPTWPNHPKVFAAAGLQVGQYPWFDSQSHGINFDGLLAGINEIPSGDVICLHACCHNPTGADPTAEQWKQIADAVYDRGLLPLLDFAYLGFGQSLQADAVALREFARPGKELLIASSYSKNFGLYRERIGALLVVTDSADTARTVASQIKSTIRTNYSSPPSHGGAIVQTILSDSELRGQWEGELAGMRDRINGMRRLFTELMSARVPDQDFSFIEKQCGMFSYSGLTADQVDTLREQSSIYIVRDGRINVAGITPDNAETLCDAIAALMRA